MNETITPLVIIDESEFRCRVADGRFFGQPNRDVFGSVVTVTGAYTHEADLVSHPGDHCDDLNADGSWAELVGIMLARARKEKPIPTETLLALGAGQAYPELALARIAQIPLQSVTLLDVEFSSRARRRIATVAPEATLIETGLFSYLQNPDGNRYSLVTTFGLHDVLRGENVEEFFRLLPNVLADSAIVFLHHFGLRINPKETAAKYGFRSIDKYSDHLYLYEPTQEKV